MVIKVAFLEQDPRFLDRLTAVFSKNYADKLEIYPFTDLEVALSSLEFVKPELLLADESLRVPEDALPEDCALAYFVSSVSTDQVDGHRAICKFQRAELIYKQIVGIVSDKGENKAALPKVGTDTSTLAALSQRPATMNFAVEQLEGRTYLTCSRSGTDPLLLGMLQNNRIPGFAAFRAEPQRLCYDIHGLRSMQEIFAQVVSRRTLLNSFDAILAALESAQDYMIDASSVVLEPQYIYFDPDTFRTALICLPFADNGKGSDEKSFFKSVMFQSIFDPNEPCDHVARIMNSLNAAAFDSAQFRKLLAELGADEGAETPEPFLELAVSEVSKEVEPLSAAEPVAQKEEEDPFADWFAPKEEKKTETEEDPFADWFAPKKEEKQPEVTEDFFDEFTTPIVSSRKKAAKIAEEAAPAEAAEFDFDFAVASKKPVTDAMKLADDLLSAALAADPTVQKDAPKEEPPVKEELPLSLDAFAAPPTKKSAARLEAEAILDALDLSAPIEEEPPVEDEALPTKQEEAPKEPARKGGFFSKLRKKEEAPKEAAPSVVPYFGSDGETTLLNVAQQTKPSAPYLLRSSNQETIVLTKAVFRIGKDKEFSDYCISDNTAISRRHANFLVRNGDVFLVDNNSTNHTYVNGAMIRSNTEIKLTHGDEIRLANEDFMLYCAGTLS